MKPNNCPCGRPQSYENCCGKIHTDIKLAKTAEDLMRSRYSAFVKGNGKYLQKSHHPKTRPSSREGKETAQWAKSVSWLRLEVLVTSKGAENETEGTVSFKAFFRDGLHVDVIEENSYFEKVDGIWYYKSVF